MTKYKNVDDGDLKRITQADVDDLLSIMRKTLPGFKVCMKRDHWHQRLIGWLLWPINREYMTGYSTTMFGNVYMPDGYEGWTAAATYHMLRHEFVHLKDARQYPLLFALSYLFLLPFVFTARAHWEMRGYAQTMLSYYEWNGEFTDGQFDWVVRQFTSSAYGWMNPFESRVRAKLKRIELEIKAGNIKGVQWPHGKGVDG